MFQMRTVCDFFSLEKMQVIFRYSWLTPLLPQGYLVEDAEPTPSSVLCV